MKNRPKSLTALSGALVAVAVSFPLQIMLMHGHPPTHLLAIISEIAPLNWASMGVSLLLSVLAYRASRGLIVATPLFIGVIALNNWLVAALQPGASAWETYLSSALAAGLVLFPLALSPVRRLMVNPKLRWWLTPARKQISLTAKVRPVKGGEVAAMTFDISESGAFISTEHAIWHEPLRPSSSALEVGAHCSLKLDLDPYRALHCIAKVIRHTGPEMSGKHPSGFALRFEGLTPYDRKLLERFLSKLREAAAAAGMNTEPLGHDHETPSAEGSIDQEPKNRMAA